VRLWSDTPESWEGASEVSETLFRLDMLNWEKEMISKKEMLVSRKKKDPPSYSHKF